MPLAMSGVAPFAQHTSIEWPTPLGRKPWVVFPEHCAKLSQGTEFVPLEVTSSHCMVSNTLSDVNVLDCWILT